MSDHRQVQKKHIRAAREWLGKAETSLDRHDDIQGDLKLMLAKAELSHVAEAGLTKKDMASNSCYADNSCRF